MAHQAGNDTGAAASVVVTFLLAAGAPVTTVVTAPPGLPATGAGGTAQRALHGWLALGVGAGLVTLGALARWRRQARR